MITVMKIKIAKKYINNNYFINKFYYYNKENCIYGY